VVATRSGSQKSWGNAEKYLEVYKKWRAGKKILSRHTFKSIYLLVGRIVQDKNGKKTRGISKPSVCDNHVIGKPGVDDDVIFQGKAPHCVRVATTTREGSARSALVSSAVARMSRKNS